MNRIIWIIIAGMALLTSCEKVIELELDESQPQLVIEARLNATANEIMVNISRSTSYFDSISINTVDDASVTLFDNQEQSYTLTWEGNGFYKSTLEAIPGITYTVVVEVEGKTYQASTTVPTSITIANIDTNFIAATAFFDEGYQLSVGFSDPANEINYYRILHQIDGVPQTTGDDLIVRDDRLFDGNPEAMLPIFGHAFASGSTIEVTIQHIDQASYVYLQEIANLTGTGGGPNSGVAAPGNPPSNWSGDVLGYFGAFHSSTIDVTMP